MNHFWLVVYLPLLKNMKVSLDDYSQYYGNIKNVPNHQPAIHDQNKSPSTSRNFGIVHTSWSLKGLWSYNDIFWHNELHGYYVGPNYKLLGWSKCKNPLVNEHIFPRWNGHGLPGQPMENHHSNIGKSWQLGKSTMNWPCSSDTISGTCVHWSFSLSRRPFSVSNNSWRRETTWSGDDLAPNGWCRKS